MNLSYSYRPKNSVKFSQATTAVSSSRRKRARGIDDIEFTSTRQRSAGILKKSKKKKIVLNKKKAKSDHAVTLKQKIFWVAIGISVLRLFFMDRGVWDFYQNKREISSLQTEISRIKNENKELVEEIRNIRYNPAYQKKMARQHLGVIARDEYLILFAQEKALKSI